MTPLDYKAMGLRIRQQRTFLNMTREQLATQVGITPTFLADIELGSKGFSLKSLNRFCEVLNMSADAILYGFDSDSKYATLTKLLDRSPKDKIEYAEKIMTLFLLSHESTEE